MPAERCVAQEGDHAVPACVEKKREKEKKKKARLRSGRDAALVGRLEQRFGASKQREVLYWAGVWTYKMGA